MAPAAKGTLGITVADIPASTMTVTIPSASQPSSTDEPIESTSDESLSVAQQEAWEELAERVCAARSVY